jgi:UDP-N-acetyl-2-amino-2-deoxyglucuronate dehydrogenase
MENIIRIGIIGCGAICRTHADAIKAIEGIELVACSDIIEEKAVKLSEEYNCDYYTDYRELLKNCNVDVIHICTPHYLHAEMAVNSMKAGKHVLVEKPMAISSKDALEMISVAKETGKKLGVCFQNRYNTTSQKIIEVLRSGNTGKIKGAKAFVTWNRGASYYKSDEWRGTWAKEGGGVLINQSIHTLDLLQWFLGEADSLKAKIDNTLLKDVIEVEDTAEGIIKFQGGSIGLFYMTNCYVADSPVEIEIVCENAVLKLSEDLTIVYADGDIEKVKNISKKTGEKACWGLSHQYLFEDFYNKLIKKEPFLIDEKEAIKTVQLIEAIYKSSQTNEFVRI